MTTFTFAATGSDSIVGVVRDGQGHPLAGARITLSRRGSPPPIDQTTSSAVGEYSFDGIAAGDYTIAAELNGFIAGTPLEVHIVSTANPVAADLTLQRNPSAPATPSPPHSPLEFQSAGIRGLIDPGGYSASTSSAAAGLLRGIEDVERADSGAGATASDWPCGLETVLRRAVNEHPDQLEANRRLGQFYAAHNQPASAIPPLQHALEVDGGDYAASLELAVAWLENGEIEKARKLLTALSEHHSNPEVHQLLAQVDERSGMLQQAGREYALAAAKDPSEKNLFGVGYESLLSGAAEESLAAFEAGLHTFPRSIPLRIGLGTAQFLLGKTSESLTSFLDATDIDPADPRAYTFIARVSGISPDQRGRVHDSFKRFLDIKPDSADANYFYALELSRESNPVDADRSEVFLKRAIQLDPDFARAHLQLADTYAQRADYQKAVPEYEAAIRLDKHLNEAHYRLALAYAHIGRADRSAQEMQIFKQSSPRNAPGNEGIDLAEFASVMKVPKERATAKMPCPTTPLVP